MEKSLKERIIENHIIFITSELNPQTSSEIIFDIMQWSGESEKIEINLYLSSNTFNFIDAIAIYDVLCNIKNPINVFCIGYVGGFAPLFIAAATKGRRYMLKHSTISFNQPYGSLRSGSNQQTEIEIEATETTKQRTIYEEILSEKLGMSLDKVHEYTEKDKEFDAKAAKQAGLIDQVLE